MRVIAIELLAMLVLVPAAAMAQTTTMLPSPIDWAHYAVVYGDVVSVRELGKSDGGPPILIAIDVKATLTGFWDASERPVLWANYGGLWPQGMPSVLRDLARSSMNNSGDRHVIAVFAWVLDEHRMESFVIFPDRVDFMPGHSGLVVVSGFDDPKVAEIISRLRAIRPKESPLSEKSLPMRPATDQGTPSPKAMRKSP